MARLADVEPIEKMLKNLVDSWTGRSFAVGGYMKALSLVKDAPTVKAVVPVYCIECKHWGPRLEDPKTAMCWLNGPQDILVRCEDDYCSRGQRRKDNDPIPAFPMRK